MTMRQLGLSAHIVVELITNYRPHDKCMYVKAKAMAVCMPHPPPLEASELTVRATGKQLQLFTKPVLSNNQ